MLSRMRSACFKNVAQQLEQLAIRIMLKVFMLYLLCKSCIIFVFLFFILFWQIFLLILIFVFGLSKLATVITKEKVMQRNKN